MPTRRTLIVGSVALVASSAAGYYVDQKFHQSLLAHRKRVSTGSQTFNSRLGQMEYAVTGKGGPVLMLHGSGGGFDQSVSSTQGFVDAGHAVICPSRFGYLRSINPPGATPAMQADSYVELLDHLKIDRTPVVGFSAGSVSAIHFAARHPSRCSALIVVVPALTISTPGGKADRPAPQAGTFARILVEYAVTSDRLFWLGCKFIPRQMFASVLATNPDLIEKANAAERKRVDQLMWNILPISARAEGLVNDVRFTSTPLEVDLDAIRIPTLAISFEDDLYGTSRAAKHLAASVKDARAVIFPTGGHVFVGHEAQIFGEINAFLRTHPT